MYIQRNDFMDRAAASIFNRRGYPNFNRELPDVYWLNYFGPAYVDFWGDKKIDALKKKYEVICSDKGGVFVQTTPQLAVADESVTGVKDYQFKKHFYKVLGEDTFMHETQMPGQPGQYVPTLEDHRDILRRIYPDVKEVNRKAVIREGASKGTRIIEIVPFDPSTEAKYPAPKS